VTKDQTTEVVVDCVPYSGSIRVLVSPNAAIAAGVQWSLDGVDWHDHAELVEDLPVGGYTLEFTSVGDWTAPDPMAVTIQQDQILELVVRWTDASGSSGGAFACQANADFRGDRSTDYASILGDAMLAVALVFLVRRMRRSSFHGS
jgi:hypothetical protein